MADLEEFYQTLQVLLHKTDTALETGDLNYAEYSERHLQRYIQITSPAASLLVTTGHHDFARLLEQLAIELSTYYQVITHFIESVQFAENFAVSNHCPKETSSGGRPRYQIDPNDIVSLKELGFSWVAIARFLGTSESTIRRRRAEFGITFSYSDISDEELDSVIKSIIQSTPNAGETLVIGSLRARGYRIQRQRVRERLCIVDGLGRAMRKRFRINRRVYSVEGPNNLWHIDTNHKLINWRIVLHGAVDGFSRTVLYVNCVNNNRAETALGCFLQGVAQFGLPLKVRTDKGGENWEIARYMVRARGIGKGSIIAGKSVHNQRIERMWGDINRVVGRHYKGIFQYMEHEGILDPLDECHLLALHFVFIPRINRSLQEFQDQWNYHPLRTMNNRSPICLWQTGKHPVTDTMSPEMLEQYGVDYEGTTVPPSEDNRVVVPEITIETPLDLWQYVESTIDPLSDDGNHGINMYLSLINLINQSI